MNSYIVMQGETFLEEQRLGILKAAMKDKAGTTPHSWERVKSLKKGDRTFHYVKGQLIAVGTVQDDAREVDSGSNSAFWTAPCEYLELDDPIDIGDHINMFVGHLPIKYAAFQPDGNGNSGYLYPCNESLTLAFLALLAASKWQQIEQLEFSYDAIRTEKYNSMTAWMMDTEYLVRKKLSDFKELFTKRQMQRWGESCAICGTDNKALLKAVYSKPWKDSVDAERVDAANGVLLCANHAALYESGQIAFTGAGTLRISAGLNEQASTFGLKKYMRIAADDGNVEYFRWHRNNRFIDKV